MILLGLDSSAKSTSAAVGSDREILAEFSAAVRLTHSQTLMPMLESVLRCAGLSLGDVDCFAVSAGPGSFTGLRIGVGAVKGLAFGAGRPCVGVSTLDALARNLPHAEGILCPVMDARCGQVYTASFENGPAGLRRLTPDEALPIDTLADRLRALPQRPIYFVGDGAELCFQKLSDTLEDVRLAGEAVRLQKGSGVILAARDKLRQAPPCSPGERAPVYLRLPQADRNRLAGNAPGGSQSNS